jgi:hypothetical protein
VQDVDREDRAKRACREWQSGRVGLRDREWRDPAGVCGQLAEHGGGNVRAGHGKPGRVQRQGEPPGADAYLETSLPARQRGR